VAIQAAPTVAETEWLLRLAQDDHSGILGVVGWVDLEADDVHDQLDRITSPHLVGVRPMVQDLPDDEWIARPAVVRGLRALEARGLVFELLARPQHLPAASRSLAQVPDLAVVVDHLAKPDYGLLDRGWVRDVSALAAREGTWMKVSGLVTEVEADWGPDRFRSHVDVVLEAFGSDRVLLGTDWPVLTLSATYREVCHLLDELVGTLSQPEQHRVWRGNCLALYGIPAPAGE